MLVGKKVVLRTFREPDVAAVVDLRDRIDEQGPHDGRPLGSLSRYMAHFRETGLWGRGGGSLLICGLDGTRFGQIEFDADSDHAHTYTLAYALYARQHWGKGYTTEALRLFCAYLLETRATLNRLQLFAHVDNIGSIKVAEKSGFQREGLARESLFVGGRHCDQYMYSRLRRDAM